MKTIELFSEAVGKAADRFKLLNSISLLIVSISVSASILLWALSL